MARDPEVRQADALEDIARSMKALAKHNDAMLKGLLYIGREVAETRKNDAPEPVELDAPEVVEAKTRIPVKTFPSSGDKPPVGWAEIDANGWVDIQIPGANLVNDLEYLTELGNIESLYISVEFGSAKMANEGGDTNAAE